VCTDYSNTEYGLGLVSRGEGSTGRVNLTLCLSPSAVAGGERNEGRAHCNVLREYILSNKVA
jgi:hypothetical protein